MIATTGFFDGVHLGHRLVIDTLLRAARERGEQSVVVTFWPHPRTVLQKDARELRLLTSLQEKRGILSALGVDRVEVVPFSQEFRSMTAEQYLRDFVGGRLDGTAIVLGYDNRMGSDGLQHDAIAALAQSLGLDVRVLDENRKEVQLRETTDYGETDFRKVQVNLQDETVSGHPGFSTTTVKLTREDLLRYVSAVGHEPTYVELAGEEL